MQLFNEIYAIYHFIYCIEYFLHNEILEIN